MLLGILTALRGGIIQIHTVTKWKKYKGFKVSDVYGLSGMEHQL